jgi:hypothetical protein
MDNRTEEIRDKARGYLLSLGCASGSLAGRKMFHKAHSIMYGKLGGAIRIRQVAMEWIERGHLFERERIGSNRLLVWNNDVDIADKMLDQSMVSQEKLQVAQFVIRASSMDISNEKP